MKEKPIDDELFGPVMVRPDGRAIHNMYIFKVKSPDASKSKWDLLEKVGVLTGPEAFRPLEEERIGALKCGLHHQYIRI
jgi:branched-chain amino acid transport system substrate-binding protein